MREQKLVATGDGYDSQSPTIDHESEKVVEITAGEHERHTTHGIDASQISNPEQNEKSTLWRKVYNTLAYTPPRCRYDPSKPTEFSMALNLLFGRSLHLQTFLTLYVWDLTTEAILTELSA